MGRRRYPKRDEAESNFEVMLAVAYRSTVAGLFLTIVFAVFGASLVADTKSLAGMGPGIGQVLLLIAAGFAALTLAGFLWRHGREVVEGLARVLGAILRRIGVQVRRRSPSATPHPPSAMERLARPLPADPTRHFFPDDHEQPLRPPPAAPAAAVAAEPASILSKGERAFYLPLRDIVAGRFDLHVKPSLLDVLQCRDHRDYRNIGPMHVDFLLCDPQTLTPRLAIELDDRSHHRRQNADQRKRELLAQRRIPLLRQRCQQAYDVAELRESIDRAIQHARALGNAGGR